MPAYYTIQVRRGTTAQWTAADPVLASGEPGYDSDLKRLKFGNGTSTWSQLNFIDVGPPQIVSGGLIANLTSQQQAAITTGTVVTDTNGVRWVYSGTGSKTLEASYVELADITPEWSVIANKPSTFTPSSHTHGNLTNDGKVGSTANLPLITGTAGLVQAGAFGTTASSFCEGNDARLSDSRVPTAHASTHQTGGSDFVANVVVSPSQITANTNNYSPGTGDIFRINSDAARDITGVVAGSSGQGLMLVNVGSYAITLKHDSGSSTAANRVLVPWEGDYVLSANGGAAVLVYDATSSRWRVI